VRRTAGNAWAAAGLDVSEVSEGAVSIVRQGLAEDGKFAAGYEAIFGKGKSSEPKPAAKASAKPSKPKGKKAPGKKKPAKKR
jgi:hypothetical protein